MQVDLFYELSIPDFCQLSQSQLFDQTLTEIELADRLDFQTTWLVEHHFMPGYSYSSCPELILAAAAQRSQRIRLGFAIIPLPYHNPIHVAERIATLDILSQGRIELGFGRGFQPQEYQAFGVDMSESRQLTADSIAIIKQALTEPRLNFHSDHFQFSDLAVTPQGIQKPHPPIWMATVSPQSFQIAAQIKAHAMCGPFKPWFMIKEDIKRFRKMTTQHSQALKVAMTVGFFCHQDAEQAKRIAKPCMEWFYQQLFLYTRPILQNLYDSYQYYHQYHLFQALLPKLAHYSVLEKLGYIIVGDPAHCRRKLQQLKQAGVDHALLAIGAGGSNSEDTQQCMKLVHDEIIPYL